MTTEIVDIADLDCIFLTYDEPKKEEFWINLHNVCPWAKRVDGVKGSHAAHKAAAAASDTDRFVLIDGDNIPESGFFNIQLRLDSTNIDCVFRWKARNEINGLMYGNGGISCWTKDFVNNMRTHEASNGSAETQVEFCFDPLYIPMYNCYSTTYPNQSPKQAWRAGFREGVKMCLDRGVKPTLKDFENRVHTRNYDHLCIWQSIGMDVENGNWAIYGARLGTYLTMLTDWDHTLVQDFSELDKLWEEYESKPSEKITEQLKTRLGLPIVDMNSEQSKFFKRHYKNNHLNRDPMLTEMEVIRKSEGW